MFENLKSILYFLKNQKKFKRIFFFENYFIEDHLSPYIYKCFDSNKTLLLTTYDFKNRELYKFNVIKISNNFFLNFLFQFLQIKFCYSSTPELGKSYFVKSAFKISKYIFIQHSPMGLNGIYKKEAFDNFDVVQVINTFQKDDLIEINTLNKKNIKIWKSKYLFFQNKNDNIKKKIEKIKVLIAPSHGTIFYQQAIDLLIDSLDQNLYHIEFRPHLMTIQKSKFLLKKIKDNFIINSGKINFSEFDILISDWSGAYIEFAYQKKQKSILIDVPQKILNDNFKQFRNKSIDITARTILGRVIKINQIKQINFFIDEVKKEKVINEKIVSNFFREYFF